MSTFVGNILKIELLLNNILYSYMFIYVYHVNIDHCNHFFALILTEYG